MIELNLSFVIQLINFGILVLVLNVFLYKPIRKVLADRRQVIDSARERTVTVDAEVQNKMDQYEARLHAAKAEAGARRTEALKLAQVEETAVLEKARKQASESLASIRVRVAKEVCERLTITGRPLRVSVQHGVTSSGVGKVKTPTLVIVGAQDYRTPVSESEQLYTALQVRGVPTALIKVPGANHHGLAGRPSQAAAKASAILAWFNRYRSDQPTGASSE